MQAFLTVGPAVGAFAMYRAPLAEYLAGQQLRHWDAPLRALAARALGALVAAEPALFAGRVLAGLLPRCLDPVLEVRASLGSYKGFKYGTNNVPAALSVSCSLCKPPPWQVS